MTVFDPQPWKRQAACRDMTPAEFYPATVGASRAAANAKTVCAACPVRSECLDYALDNGERFGIWGGRSPKERQRIRRLRQEGVHVDHTTRVLPRLEKRPARRTSTAECGTYAGYKRHKNWDDPPCPECLAANSRAVRRWNDKKRETA